MNRFIPLAVFVFFVAIAVWKLWDNTQGDNPDALPSAFIEKPAPEFALPTLLGMDKTVTTADLKGDGPVVLNFWASWCAPCRVEHPELVRLAAEGVRVVGINYKNDPADARQFLDRLGNPFEAVGVDERGRTGIDFGVAALPETFVLDAEGTIVYKHTGPINPGELDEKIRPAIEAARR